MEAIEAQIARTLVRNDCSDLRRQIRSLRTRENAFQRLWSDVKGEVETLERVEEQNSAIQVSEDGSVAGLQMSWSVRSLADLGESDKLLTAQEQERRSSGVQSLIQELQTQNTEMREELIALRKAEQQAQMVSNDALRKAKSANRTIEIHHQRAEQKLEDVADLQKESSFHHNESIKAWKLRRKGWLKTKAGLIRDIRRLTELASKNESLALQNGTEYEKRKAVIDRRRRASEKKLRGLQELSMNLVRRVRTEKEKSTVSHSREARLQGCLSRSLLLHEGKLQQRDLPRAALEKQVLHLRRELALVRRKADGFLHDAEVNQVGAAKWQERLGVHENDIASTKSQVRAARRRHSQLKTKISIRDRHIAALERKIHDMKHEMRHVVVEGCRGHTLEKTLDVSSSMARGVSSSSRRLVDVVTNIERQLEECDKRHEDTLEMMRTRFVERTTVLRAKIRQVRMRSRRRRTKIPANVDRHVSWGDLKSLDVEGNDVDDSDLGSLRLVGGENAADELMHSGMRGLRMSPRAQDTRRGQLFPIQSVDSLAEPITPELTPGTPDLDSEIEEIGEHAVLIDDGLDDRDARDVEDEWLRDEEEGEFGAFAIDDEEDGEFRGFLNGAEEEGEFRGFLNRGAEGAEEDGEYRGFFDGGVEEDGGWFRVDDFDEEIEESEPPQLSEL